MRNLLDRTIIRAHLWNIAADYYLLFFTALCPKSHDESQHSRPCANSVPDFASLYPLRWDCTEHFPLPISYSSLLGIFSALQIMQMSPNSIFKLKSMPLFCHSCGEHLPWTGNELAKLSIRKLQQVQFSKLWWRRKRHGSRGNGNEIAANYRSG